MGKASHRAYSRQMLHVDSIACAEQRAIKNRMGKGRAPVVFRWQLKRQRSIPSSQLECPKLKSSAVRAVTWRTFLTVSWGVKCKRAGAVDSVAPAKAYERKKTNSS